MNTSKDNETGIVGLGLTPEEARESMRFYVERSGKLSQETLKRRKEIHTWLPRPNILHVTGVGAIQYKDNRFINLVTGRKVPVYVKPLSHYLCLYSAFDGRLSFKDFTVTISQEVNRFLSNISDKFLTLDDFPYISPGETTTIKWSHICEDPSMAIIETQNDTITLRVRGIDYVVDKIMGVDYDCLISYLFAYAGYTYDGTKLGRCTYED